jgi:hypothetical protein
VGRLLCVCVCVCVVVQECHRVAEQTDWAPATVGRFFLHHADDARRLRKVCPSLPRACGHTRGLV